MSFFEIIEKEIGIFNKARLRIIDRAAKEIHRNFDRINSKEGFLKYIKPFESITSFDNNPDRLQFDQILTSINYRILELIFADGMVKDKRWAMREENLRKLLYLSKDHHFKKPWERILSSLLANTICSNSGLIKTKIEGSDDLITVIESLLSVGLKLNWSSIKERVERNLERIKVVEKRVVTRNTASQVLSALDQYANLENNQVFLDTRFSKKEVKIMMERRVKRKRIVVDGQHLVDHMMMNLHRKLHDYKCEHHVDLDCEGEIGVYHTIPLKYGIKLGGIDAPVNLQVLCNKHHNETRSLLTKKLDTMGSEYDRLDYLQSNYPNIIKQSLLLSRG